LNERASKSNDASPVLSAMAASSTASDVFVQALARSAIGLAE